MSSFAPKPILFAKQLAELINDGINLRANAKTFRQWLDPYQVRTSSLIDASAALGIYREDSVAIARALLEWGADLEARSDRGMSPLCFAAAHASPRCTKLFLQQAAQLEHAAEDGETPLWWACYGGMDGATSSWPAQTRGSLGQARRQVLNLLLDAGANPNVTDRYGRSPLSMLSECGNALEVDLLIEHGANVNICCNDGRTPLFEAITEGHVEAVKVLLLRGADLDWRDNHGNGIDAYLQQSVTNQKNGEELSELVRATRHLRALFATTTGAAGRGLRL